MPKMPPINHMGWIVRVCATLALLCAASISMAEKQGDLSQARQHPSTHKEEQISIAVQEEKIRQLEERLKTHLDVYRADQTKNRDEVQKISNIGQQLATTFSERATYYINAIATLLAIGAALGAVLTIRGIKSLNDVENRIKDNFAEKEARYDRVVENIHIKEKEIISAVAAAEKAVEDANVARNNAIEALERTKQSRVAVEDILEQLLQKTRHNTASALDNADYGDNSEAGEGNADKGKTVISQVTAAPIFMLVWPESAPGLILETLPKNISLHINEDRIRYFWKLLANSLSLSKREKERVWNEFPRVTQEQFDGLIAVFEDEQKEFTDLLAKESDTILGLSGKAAVEWLLHLEKMQPADRWLDSLLKGEFDTLLAERNREPDFVIGVYIAVFTERPELAGNTMEWALRFCKEEDRDKVLTQLIVLAKSTDKATGLTVWTKLDALMSKNAFLHKMFATWAKDHDEIALAEHQYRQAIVLGPDDSDSPVMLAGLLNRQHRFEEAKDVFDKAMELFSRRENVVGAYAVFCDRQVNDLEIAERLYRQALGINPSSFWVLGNLAGLLLSIGRKEEGKTLMEKAENQPKTNPEGLLELWFYRYAHFHEQSALHEISRLVNSDILSLGWNLERNVERAVQDGHPEPAFLKALAELITQGTSMAPEMQEKLTVPSISNG